MQVRDTVMTSWEMGLQDHLGVSCFDPTCPLSECHLLSMLIFSFSHLFGLCPTSISGSLAPRMSSASCSTNEFACWPCREMCSSCLALRISLEWGFHYFSNCCSFWQLWSLAVNHMATCCAKFSKSTISRNGKFDEWGGGWRGEHDPRLSRRCSRERDLSMGGSSSGDRTREKWFRQKRLLAWAGNTKKTEPQKNWKQHLKEMFAYPSS